MSPTGRAAALVTELERTVTLVERVVAQTRIRIGGQVPDGSTRVLSLHHAASTWRSQPEERGGGSRSVPGWHSPNSSVSSWNRSDKTD